MASTANHTALNVVGDVTLAYKDRYVGPLVSLVDGLAMVGRPHISFASPEGGLLQIVVKFGSSDDSIGIMLLPSDETGIWGYGIPDDGFLFQVECPDKRRRRQLSFWSPIREGSEFKVTHPLPLNFITSGTKVQIQLDFRNLMDLSFTVTSLEGSENVVYRLETALPSLSVRRVVIFNREKGRLSFLESIQLDGTEYLGDLKCLLEESSSMNGIIESTDNFPQFRVDINPGMKNQTTLDWEN